MEREDIVAAVLAAAGGSLTGRVRLQKAVYLLDRLGLESGFGFEYHHYGPYSRDLENAAGDAKAFGLVEETFGQRESDGATFSVFKLTDEGRRRVADEAGEVRAAGFGEIVHLFAETNVTVLELAATVDWLWRVEKYADWRSEIARRKGVKIQHGRLGKAVDLLTRLGLEPPTARSA